ncbi:MarR family transcriptional regulator [Ruegeria litorea]|uniref:MarR family transcriptional regulator n=1 Tax=Falsiruegeria litorea TaxID=1280831 RepID=A0ABS5WQF1_9RHOB|nr:MarR family transcriptional regulator [Falsiruegeria litorea]MBT3141366.1 MarR family transcriptional regulator [Falsiruegeria litorea]
MASKGKRRDAEGQYLTLPYAQLKSTAWRSLSGAAVKVLLELHTRFNGGNNGNVRLSMNEAVKALGISKGTAQRAFVELEEKGFIVLHTPGNWYNRRAHEWRLTTKRMQTAKGLRVATNDWRFWQSKTKDGPAENPSPKSTGPMENPRPGSGSTTEPVKA